MLNNIAENVVVNILSIVITSVIIAVIYSVSYYIQRSSFMKSVRRFINPDRRVYKSPITVTDIAVASRSAYVPLLSEDEQKLILSRDGKRNLFNGDAVRLDNLSKDGTATLSKVHFFDFLTTNLVIKPASRSKQSAFSSLYDMLFSDEVKKIHRLEHRVKAAVYRYQRRSFNQILAIGELANIVAVSVLLQDSTGRYLIVHRGNKVAISSGNFATSCAGSVSKEDLQSENPFIACAKRELKEELNLECNLKVDGVVISRQKLQPSVLLSGTLDFTFEEAYDAMIAAEDFHEENSELFAVPREKLVGIVKRHQFTDIAAYQLAGGVKHWISHLPVNIQNYKLK